jgi:hypothetical protein
MTQDRYRPLIATCVLAGTLLIGLLLALGAPVRGESVVPPAASTGDAFARVGASLQSTGSFTVELPLVLKVYPPPPPVFGVQMHTIAATHGLPEAVAGGAYWVRSGVFQWDRIEPVRTSPPTYHWEAVDENSLRNAYENGLHAIATIQFTPLWAQKYLGSYCGPIVRDRFDEYAQFLAALVNRYKDPPYGVKYWELGNEPDHQMSYSREGFGCWGDAGGDPYYGGRYYGEMLKVAYPAIKAVDPGAQVLIGGLLLDCDPSNPPPGKDCTISQFLEGILKSGGGPYFDIVSFHAYTYYGGALGQMANGNWAGAVTSIPEKTAFLRGVLNRYGYGDKELINTESALIWEHEDTASLRETQGMYMPRAYAEALALGLLGQVHYDMNGMWKNSGLLYPDLTPKPAYYAYKTASGFLSAVDYVGPVASYPSGIQGYTFRQQDRSGYVDVIWSKSTVLVPVTLPVGVSAYTRYNEDLLPPIQIGNAPVYVRWP